MAQATNTQKVKYYVDFNKNGNFLELSDVANKLTTATESIDTTSEDYATFGSAYKESEITQYQSTFDFVGKVDTDAPLYEALVAIQHNLKLGDVNNIPYKFEIYNDNEDLLSTTSYGRNCISLSSLVGGAADGLMEYTLQLKTSSAPTYVAEAPVAKVIPSGIINDLQPTETDIEVTYGVTDDDRAITGNLRIDVEETAALGTVVATDGGSIGDNKKVVITGLTATTDYSVFVRCSYDDTVNTPVDDFELATDTTTTSTPFAKGIKKIK